MFKVVLIYSNLQKIYNVGFYQAKPRLYLG